MPNNSYLRSRRREQEIVADARKRGWIAARSAGSKSPVDCWLFDPMEKVLIMVQVKTKKGGRNRRIVDKQIWTEVHAIDRWIHYD